MEKTISKDDFDSNNVYSFKLKGKRVIVSTAVFQY